ncbi:MAG TPA: flagellar protein FlaG [Candidatus Sulfotelmatobacter sp.]|nr:flagellar protein FlaG [Candidatus Sulfotelmatobacter sp.]
MDVLSVDAAATAAAAPAPPSELAQPADPGPQGGTPVVDAPQDETLHSALSQLVGNGSQVSVQFRVVHDPNEIVTVFTNAQTGQVITQFPPESMVLIAQFFNKLAGAVLDHSA